MKTHNSNGQYVPETWQQYLAYGGCLVEILQQAQQPLYTSSEQTILESAEQPENL